jgi:predicted permease
LPNNNVRFALRALGRAPGFAAAAIACLALGIGASTAIFSIVNGVLLQPLPYRDSANLVRVYTEFPTFPNGGLKKFWVSPPEFRQLQGQTETWGQLEAWVTGASSLQGGSEPLRINLCFISGGMMPMLGVAPQLGRWITPAADDPGVQQQLVLSNGLWKTAFGGDPEIVGRETLLDGRKVLIAGVMPAGFDFPPGAAQPAEAWSPLQLTQALMGQFGSHFLSLVAHLKPGVSAEKARAYLPQIEMAMSAGSASVFQMHRIDRALHPLSLYGFQADVIGDARPAMFLLLGAVAFFLLIACVNVSSLLLTRADARRREIAVRRAIGAGGPMLIRQFAVEGLVLAGAGGTLGVLLGWIGVRYLATTNAGLIPRIRDISVDWHVLLFALAVAGLSGLVFCMTPMFQSLRAPLNACLNAASGRSAGSRVSGRLRAALVVAEISLALVLLIGSGLLTRALLNLQQVKVGFRSDHVLTAQLSLSGQSFSNADYLRQFLIRLRQRLESLPGLEASSIAAGLPPERRENDNDTTIENFIPRQGGPVQNVAFYQAVEGNFFQAIGANLIEGRFFDSRDGQDAPRSAIVNRTMATLFWPGQSAIGKRLKPGGGPNWTTVIGVVDDISNAGLSKPAATELFLPWSQNPGSFGSGYIVAKTKGDPAQLAIALRTAVRDVDSAVPVSHIRSMEEVMGEARSQPRFLAGILGIFSILALTLAALGVYGVVSYSVSQRTAEFGIRMALGASGGDVRSLVLREGMLLSVFGLGIGLTGAVLATRTMRSLLFQVSRFDPMTFVIMAVVLIGVALAACVIPARRATTVDPMRALRYE